MVVVLRNIKPAGGGKLRRRIVQQRRRRDTPFGNRLRIQKRLERRARLAQGEHAVHLASGTEVARRTDPGKDFAAGVVEHDDGAVFDMAAAQFAQLLPQGLHGEALERGAQGGLDGPLVAVRGAPTPTLPQRGRE